MYREKPQTLSASAHLSLLVDFKSLYVIHIHLCENAPVKGNRCKQRANQKSEKTRNTGDSKTDHNSKKESTLGHDRQGLSGKVMF